MSEEFQFDPNANYDQYDPNMGGSPTQPGSDFVTPGSPSEQSGDTLFQWTDEASQWFGAVQQAMNAGQPGTNVMTGKDIPGAEKISGAGNGTTTGTDSGDSFISKALNFAKDGIKWDDPKVQAAAMTVGMGALSGMGQRDLAEKKMAQDRELKERELKLLESSTAINQQKMANQQGLSSMKFKQPGLISGAFKPAPLVPISQR